MDCLLPDGRKVWGCGVRNARVKYCPANVVEHAGDVFMRGMARHLHEPALGAQTVAVIVRDLKVLLMSINGRLSSNHHH